MTLKEGATQEINSRWPEHKQRNCALVRDFYGDQYYKNMSSGIRLVVDLYQDLKESGASTWSISSSDSSILDDLAGI